MYLFNVHGDVIMVIRHLDLGAPRIHGDSTRKGVPVGVGGAGTNTNNGKPDRSVREESGRRAGAHCHTYALVRDGCVATIQCLSGECTPNEAVRGAITSGVE